MLGLVDGRGADLPVGGQPPGDGAADAAVLRLARTSPHNKVFLGGGARARSPPTPPSAAAGTTEPPVTGLRAAARVYAGWGFSQAFYWDEVWREMGYTSLEDFLVGFWEGFFLDGRDANNLLMHARDLAARATSGARPGFDGDPGKALASIPATRHRHARREGPLLPARGRGVGGLPACRTPSCG